jgi:hypothetical protein
VAVEKLIFLKNLPNFGDRKCPDDPRESFIAHPDAILFLRFSLSGVFQQPRLITTITSGWPVIGPERSNGYLSAGPLFLLRLLIQQLRARVFGTIHTVAGQEDLSA